MFHCTTKSPVRVRAESPVSAEVSVAESPQLSPTLGGSAPAILVLFHSHMSLESIVSITCTIKEDILFTP